MNLNLCIKYLPLVSLSAQMDDAIQLSIKLSILLHNQPIYIIKNDKITKEKKNQKRKRIIIHLYIEFRFLVKYLPLVPLPAQVIDAILDVVVVLVVVLCRPRVDVVQPGVIAALVLGQICVRQKRRRQVLEARIIGVDDTAATRGQISLLGPVGPLGRCQLVGRIFVRGVAP